MKKRKQPGLIFLDSRDSHVSALSDSMLPPESMAAEQIGVPTLAQWTELYGIAKKIRQLEPWDHLLETHLITILLPGREEPVYCSVMGNGDECCAVAVYPGYEAVNSYYRLLDAANGDFSFLAGLEQDCLVCHFGNREEVEPTDREIYKALNLRFRGRNEWIYFRCMETGYVPWRINSAQADLLIETLQNLAAALTYLADEDIQVDFDGGETLLRAYAPDTALWTNTVEKMPPIPVVTRRLIVDNEILMAQINRRPRGGGRLEFEVAYLPTPIQEKKGERPFLPLFAILVDKTAKRILDQHIADDGQPMETAILDMLTQYIENYGRPQSIQIRDGRAGGYIGDFCQKAGIKLVKGKGVPLVDRLLANMLASL